MLATGKLFFSPDGQHLPGKLRTERQVEALRSLDLKTGELKTVPRLPSMRQPWALSDDGKWIACVTTIDVAEQQAGNDGPRADLWKVPVADGDPPRTTIAHRMNSGRTRPPPPGNCICRRGLTE